MTYELINRRTANTLGSFASERDALSAYEKIQAANEHLAAELVLVEFDDNGKAIAP